MDHPDNLHEEYIPIWEEVAQMPATTTDDDFREIFFWIFLNRLLYGMRWGNRYG